MLKKIIQPCKQNGESYFIKESGYHSTSYKANEYSYFYLFNYICRTPFWMQTITIIFPIHQLQQMLDCWNTANTVDSLLFFPTRSHRQNHSLMYLWDCFFFFFLFFLNHESNWCLPSWRVGLGIYANWHLCVPVCAVCVCVCVCLHLLNQPVSSRL